MADKAITRRLKIFVNGEEVDATITNLRKNLAKFRTLANREIEGTDKFKKYNKEVSKLEGEYDQARKAQKTFREDVKLTAAGVEDGERALGDFTASFSQMLQGFRSGDILQIKEGFNGVKNGIRGATKAALAFIATPIGIAITALVGIGVAAKAWFDYNSQIVEALRLTQQITGETGEAANQARIRGEALADTFDVDFKETLLTANSLAQQFGITFEEAFDVLENQLVRGQKNNSEFFQSLNEYPTFFKQAGFSAEEFGRIISTGYDLGIYSDKLPDALKEFDLAIKEQTKTTRDALVNAFGAPFTDEILEKVKTGEITSKEALEAIAVEADKANINVQQNAQLTADLFKGAGEDAGGALKIFDAYNQAIVQNQRELTESEAILQEQINLNKELDSILSSVFSTGDEGFGLLVDKGKLFVTEVLINLLKIGVDVYNYFVDLNNQSGTFSAILAGLGDIATAPFKVIGILIDNAKIAFSGLGDIIEGVFTLNTDKIAEGMKKTVAAGFGALSEIKKAAKADIEEIKNAFAGNNKLERKTLGSFKTTDDEPPKPDGPKEGDTKFEGGIKYIFKGGKWVPVDNNTGGGTGNGDDDKKDKPKDDEDGLTAEDKRILESKKKLTEFLKLFDEEQKILKQIEGLEEAEAAQLKEELELEAKYLKLTEQAEGEKELLIQLKEAKDTELAAIDKKYKDAEAKADAEHLKKITKQQQKAHEERLRARRQLNDEIINGIVSLAGSETKVGQALLIAKQIIAAKETLIEISKLKNKASIAAADATLSVTQGTAKTASAGFPAAIPLLLLFAAQAVGIFASVRKATKAANQVAPPSFARGGDTGRGNLGLGSNSGGFVRGVVEEEEYVIPKYVRNMPGIPQVIQYLEAKRTGNDASFAEGGDTSGNTILVPDSGPDNVMVKLMEAIVFLNENLTRGLYINYTLTDEIDRRELAQKLDDTINESKGN